MKELLANIEKLYMEFGDSSEGRTPSEILEDLEQYHDSLLKEIGRGGQPIDKENLEHLKTVRFLILHLRTKLEEERA